MAAKKDNIFSRAKAYCAKHPRTSFQDAIKIVAKKKTAKKKPAAKKKSATVGKKPRAKKTAAPRKLKIKIKPGKKGGGSFTISGMHIKKVEQELRHQEGLTNSLNRHRELLRTKGLTPGEKKQIRADIKRYQGAIRTSKQHVTALKRSI